MNLGSGEKRSLQIHGHPHTDRELLRIQLDAQEELVRFARERQLPVSGAQFPHPKRWSSIRYDPDGHVWVVPAVDPDNQAVGLRIPLRNSASETHVFELVDAPAGFFPNGVHLVLESTHGEGWSDLIRRTPTPDGRRPLPD